jgi:hypothetical protein
MERPDGIIITISQQMLKEKGYRNWLRNYLNAMEKEDHIYYMRQGAQPKQDILYVYLCIGGKVRYRSNFVMSEGPGEKTFTSAAGSHTIYGRAWIIMSGPVVKPEFTVPMKGFQGFRYTQKLF